MTENEQDQVVADYLSEEGCLLKELQQHLIEEGVGDVPAAVRVTRRLKKAGVIDTTKEGKHYLATRGSGWDEWESSVWEPATPPAKAVVGVRLRWDKRGTKDEWKELIGAYKRGEVHQVFVPADATVVAYKTADGQLVRVDG